MPKTVQLLLLWLAVMSLFSLILYGWDKLMAIWDRRRIPEAALLAAAAAGGAPGAALGMLLFRHKIRKPRFTITVPICLFLQAALLLYAWLR